MQKFLNFLKKGLDTYIILLIVVLHVGCSLYTAHDYGITWDAPDNIESGKAYYEAIKQWDKELTHQQIFPERYPPFANTLLYAFAYRVGPEIPNWSFKDRIHIGVTFFFTFALVIMYLFSKEILKSRFFAIVAVFLLATYPRIFEDSHNNVKDIPLLSFFVCSLYLGYLAVVKKNWIYSLLCGLSIGIGIAIKFNAIFLPVILLAWILLIQAKEFSFDKKSKLLFLPKLRIDLLMIPFVGLISLYFLWPYLHKDLLLNSFKVLEYFTTVWRGGEVLFFGQTYYSGVNLPWYYAPVYLAIASPLSVILLFIFGILYFFRNDRNSQGILLMFVTIFIVLVRYLSKSTVTYDGVRHFQEVVPAIIIIAVYGIQQLYVFAQKKVPKSYATVFTFFLACIAIGEGLFAIILLHPYQTAYYNLLVNGPAGADKKFDIEYWCNFHNEALRWIEENGEGDKSVTVLRCLSADRIAYYDDYKHPISHEIESNSKYITLQNRPSIFKKDEIEKLGTYRLVHTVTRMGAEIGYIYERIN